jgi:Fe-S-cluster-containing hydrogenase component 2
MKLFSCSLLVAAAVGDDACTRYCEHEGPAVCLAGSWTKADGTCHGFVYRESDICYHCAATARECPADGVPLTAQRATQIMDLIEQRLTAAPVDWNDEEFWPAN